MQYPYVTTGLLPFHWHKVLPISYENYLSETEILECMKNKLNELAEKFNQFVETLPDTIRVECEKQFAILIEPYRERINDLEQGLAELTTSVEMRFSEITADLSSIHDTLARIDNALKLLDATIEILETNLVDLINETSDRLMDYIKQSNENLRLEFDTDQQKQTDMLTNRIDARADLLFWYMKKWRDDMKKYVDDATYNLQVINPITGIPDTLQHTLDSLYALHQGCPTCEQYRSLQLSCADYAMLNLTCYEYRTGYPEWAIHFKPKQVFYNEAGLITPQPTDAFNQLLQTSANMSDYSWSCIDLDKILQRANVGLCDTYGLYVYGNVFKSAPVRLLRCKIEPVTIDFLAEHKVSSGQINAWEYTTVLEPDMLDNTDLEYPYQIKWGDGTGAYYPMQPYIDWINPMLMSNLMVQVKSVEFHDDNSPPTVTVRADSQSGFPSDAPVAGMFDCIILVPISNIR